jgi:cytochrome c oxidase subunit 1/cytochrome c oxidase subunit I+III
MGWDWLNLITTLGSFLFGIGVLMFIWNVMRSYRRGAPAGDNPWDAPSLEWATSSPPPPYNFAVIPSVASRHPLWEDRLGDPDRSEKSIIHAGLALEQGKETLATTPLDAEPDLIVKMPDDTPVPLFLALSMTVVTIGLALVAWWVVIVGIICVAVSIFAWLWPEVKLGETAVPVVTETPHV